MRNFKKIMTLAIFLLICVVCNSALNFALYPYNYARIDIHNIETNQYDDIFLGSSHGKCGINPAVINPLTNRSSTNLCMGGEYMQDVYYLTKEISRNHKPKRIIYELDPGYWVTRPTQGTDYASFYQEFPMSLVKAEYFADKIIKADFRTTLFPWYTYRQYFKNAPENIKTKLSDTYKDYDPAPFTNEAQTYEPGGFISRKVLEGEKPKDQLILWDRKELQEDACKYFEKLVAFCQKNDIELMVITTPVPAEIYQEYQQQYDDAAAFFADYMQELGVTYYDFNMIELPQFDRSIDAYADYEGHMYGDTANRFSEILAGYL